MSNSLDPVQDLHCDKSHSDFCHNLGPELDPKYLTLIVRRDLMTMTSYEKSIESIRLYYLLELDCVVL